MRLLIHVLACLVFAGISNAYANDAIYNIGDKENKTLVKKTTKKTMSTLERIPGKTLAIEVDIKRENLKVELSGADEKLDWIIFQPKGKVISRLSTSTKIDEIKIDSLDSGQYVLMVKDASGRTLFQVFDKV